MQKPLPPLPTTTTDLQQQHRKMASQAQQEPKEAAFVSGDSVDALSTAATNNSSPSTGRAPSSPSPPPRAPARLSQHPEYALDIDGNLLTSHFSQPSSSPSPTPHAADSPPASVDTNHSQVFTDFGLCRALNASPTPNTVKDARYLAYAEERLSVLVKEHEDAKEAFAAIEDERLMGPYHDLSHVMSLNTRYYDALNATNKAERALATQEEGIEELKELKSRSRDEVDGCFTDVQMARKVNRETEEREVLAKDKEEAHETAVENEQLKETLASTSNALEHANARIRGLQAHCDFLKSENDQLLDESEAHDAGRNASVIQEMEYRGVIHNLEQELHKLRSQVKEGERQHMETSMRQRDSAAVMEIELRAERNLKVQAQRDSAVARNALKEMGNDHQLQNDLAAEMDRNTTLQERIDTERRQYTEIIDAKDAAIQAEMTRNTWLQREVFLTTDRMHDMEIATRRANAPRSRRVRPFATQQGDPDFNSRDASTETLEPVDSEYSGATEQARLGVRRYARLVVNVMRRARRNARIGN
ncbi:hypothetical protein MBLNU230_g6358t1 [Neophaeotheca triangularis]